VSKPVGFDQKILLHHLDFTANQTSKNSRKNMYTVLDGFLRDDITGAKSRKNAITMLMKIWYLSDKNLHPIQYNILEQFNQFTKNERLCVHWGLTVIAYPFFKDVASELGRLFQLQDEVSSAAIGRRMKEAYGDRRRVEVATSAVLSSMKAWDIIQPNGSRSYILNEKIEISNTLVQSFLVQVLFCALNTDSLYVEMIENYPAFFPFELEINVTELREENTYSFHYQGVKNLVVEKTNKPYTV